MSHSHTPQEVLDLQLRPGNSSGAGTVRGYLVALLDALWRGEDRFSGKRPFGYSSWKDELYQPIVEAGAVPGRLDEDGYLASVDTRQADELILAAIASMDGPAQSTGAEQA